MSAKVLPRNNRDHKSSRSMDQDDGFSEKESRLAGQSHTSDEPHKEANLSSRRASQLPQRTTMKQSSIRNDCMKASQCSRTPLSAENGEIHCKTGVEVVVEKNSALSKQLNGSTYSSRTKKGQMLAPKSLGGMLSTHRQHNDIALPQIRSQRVASNRSRSQLGEPHMMASRSSSSETKAKNGSAELITHKAIGQATKGLGRSAQAASKAPRTELETVVPNSHGTQRISSHGRKKYDLKPAQAIHAIPGHARPGNQPITNHLNIGMLPSTEVRARDISSGSQHRPPFTTLQQHFSPKKILKAPTASTSAQFSNNHNGSLELSNETIQMQTELTHLHLLLSSAPLVQTQWERNTQHCLQSHFERLHGRHVQLNDVAQSYQASLNHSALKTWCENMSGIELAEKVQLLSQNVLEVPALMESGGRYTRVLSGFEVWFATACRIRDTRNRAVDRLGQDLEFIQDIGDDWKTEMAGLDMKLTSYARELRSLDKLQGNAALVRLLFSLQRVVVNLLDELSTIRSIEDDLMVQEALWIEAMIDGISFNPAGRVSSVASASCQGIWLAET